jgi:16S rRNA processing protein RimM
MFEKEENFFNDLFENIEKEQNEENYKKNLYVLKEDLKLKENEYLDSDLIGLKVLVHDEEKGNISDIRNSGNNKFLVIKNLNKEIFVPYQDEFIKEVNIKENYIIIEPIKGMF